MMKQGPVRERVSQLFVDEATIARRQEGKPRRRDCSFREAKVALQKGVVCIVPVIANRICIVLPRSQNETTRIFSTKTTQNEHPPP